jgi:hypothetical protein
MPKPTTMDSRILAILVCGLVTRPAQDRHDPVIHYDTSGNQVIKHGATREPLGSRDKLGRELGILCFEMEPA